MFSRIKDKFSNKKPTEDHTHFDRGNSNSNPKNNPFLDVPEEAPPAYEPTQKTVPLLHVPRRGASPAPSISSITNAEDKYAFLSTFDTIFIIDDSGSMAGRSWREVREALRTIGPICTSHDPDGIDVYFLNHRSPAVGTGVQSPGGYFQIRDANQVQHLFESVRPCGATPTGSRLHSILKPYVAHLPAPVNIIVITDGCPTDDPESIIIHHAKKLDQIEAPPHQVGIQFFQVGNELGATKALRELDDDLADQGIRDMVDTATWNSATSEKSNVLTADGILKVVLGAVVRRLDRRPNS
ncbi:von Willebrand factor A-like domain superfamily [Fusarium oxysporum f. sp. vasinfectum]|nr:von Willebrand factor A-like domain superfamily [Fusarium oxysporum f. sp. vasinfectum]